MATAGPVVTELPAQEVRFLFGTMMDLRMLPNELKHTGNIAEGEFKIVAHFPAIHKTNGTESNYLARHKTFRGGLYSTYQDGPYKIDEVNWDATNRAGVHMVTMTKYGQTVEFPTQPSKTMPGSLKLMVQEYVESLKVPGFVIRCSGLGGALEPKKGTTDEYNVILLSGDAKCPKKLANHVPAKYHAEDESIFHAQVGPWCGNAESFEASGSGDKMTFGRMEWSWDTDEDDVEEDRINDLIEDEIQQDGAESGSGTLTEQNEEGVSYDIDYTWNHVFSDYNTAETGYHAAESFAAASIARADLPREKRNVLSSVKSNYDPSFSWSACNWGPYFNRYAAEGSNKFYSVWVWERSPGIYTAMGAYGGLGQNPRLFNVGQTRDLQQAVNMAKKKLQSKQKKGYQTYTAKQMAQLGDSFFRVIPNTGGGDTALGSGRGVPQWYGAESAFDKLANKVAQGYIKKGKSRKEALEIGRKTAYTIGAKKYGKAGMKRKSMEGRMLKKSAEVNPLYFEQVGGHDALGVGLPVIANSFGEGSAGGSGQGVPQFYGAEDYDAETNFSGVITWDWLAKVVRNDDYVEVPKALFNDSDLNDIDDMCETHIQNYAVQDLENGEAEMGLETSLGDTLLILTWSFDYDSLKAIKGNNPRYGAEEFEAPMPFHSPSKGDVNKVIKSIRARHKGIRMKGSPTYITERKGGSNKYHVFQMTNLGGFNGYGRIGHTMDVFGPMSPKQYQSKLISKMKKGYKETGY